MARFNIVEASALNRFQIIEDENGAYYSTNTVGDTIMKISPAKEMYESVFFDYSPFFNCNDLVAGESNNFDNVNIEMMAFFLLDAKKNCYFFYTPGVLKRKVISVINDDKMNSNNDTEKLSYDNEQRLADLTSEIDITLSNLLGDRRDEENVEINLEPLTEEKIDLPAVIMPDEDKEQDNKLLGVSQFIEEDKTVKESFWKRLFNSFRRNKKDSVAALNVIEENNEFESIELSSKLEQPMDNFVADSNADMHNILPIPNTEVNNDEMLDKYLSEKITVPFRQNMKLSLDKIESIILNNAKEKDDLTVFEEVMRSLKLKLGIIQDLNRVQQIIDSKNLTEAKISVIEGKELTVVLNERDQDSLMSFKDLMATYDKEKIDEEYQRLMFIKITNLSVLETAKRINARDNLTFNTKAFDSTNNLFNVAFTKEIVTDLESLKTMSLRMNISDSIKKQLIDEYHQIDLIINIYRKEIIKYNEALQVVNDSTKLTDDKATYLKV